MISVRTPTSAPLERTSGSTLSAGPTCSRIDRDRRAARVVAVEAVAGSCRKYSVFAQGPKIRLSLGEMIESSALPEFAGMLLFTSKLYWSPRSPTMRAELVGPLQRFLGIDADAGLHDRVFPGGADTLASHGVIQADWIDVVAARLQTDLDDAVHAGQLAVERPAADASR